MTPARRRSLLWRFGLVIIAAQALVAVALGWYALAKVRQFHRRETVANLERLTPIVADRLAPLVTRPGALAEATDAIAEGAGIRLTVIAADGVVLADSHHDPAEMDNHRYRREIDEALSRGSGRAIRFSDTLDRDMAYYARGLDGADGTPAVVRTAMPLTVVDAALTRVLRGIGIAALISLAMTFGVIYLASRRLGLTIGRIADGAARIAEGDLRHRIGRPGAPELAVIADALNDMAESFDRQLRQIETQRAEQRAILQSMSNGMIALDPEQRVLSVNRAAAEILGLDAAAAPRGRLLQEVVREPELNRFVADAVRHGAPARGELTLQARGGATVEAVSEPLLDADRRRVGLLVLVNDVTQLRRLESMRSDFAANVSHELRTPITNIKGYIETMQEVGCEDERQAREFLDVIGRNAERLEAIIEDLLALARLESADTQETIERTKVSIGEVVEAVVHGFEDLRERNRITIRREIEPGLAALGARQLLEQAIGNLVSNALTYGGEGTTVTIAGRAAGDGELAIEVTDEGPGIAPAHLPRLFERFYRVDRARSRAMGGTGLGLAIVKHIALVHGGRAEVESTLGRGSTFRVVLPRA